jgi:hypothetical protein
MGYTESSVAVTTGTGSILTVKPGSNRGIAAFAFMVGGTDSGTFAGRYRLARATGGLTPSAVTVEKTNSRQASTDVTGADSWSTDPTVSGNSIISMAKVASTTHPSYRRWVVPNPRYPITEEPSGSILDVLDSIAGGIDQARQIAWGEQDAPGLAGAGRYRGRRARTAAGFFIQDEFRGFQGLSTQHKGLPGANGYTFLNALDWPTAVQSSLATFLNLLNGAAGTTYPIALDGSVTPSGSIVRQAGKALAGSVAATGALLRQTQKALAGSITAAGALAKQLARTLAGSVTPTGALTRQIGKALTSSTTAAGAIVKQIGKALGGSVTVTGALTKLLARTLTGSVAVTGALVRQVGKALGGAVTAAGDIVRQVGKACAGTITAAGALAREIHKTFAGSVTASGTLAAVKAVLLVLSGSVTPTGSLTRQVGKGLLGSVSAVGDLAKRAAVTFAGTVAASGALAKQVALTFLGTVAAAGGVVLELVDLVQAWATRIFLRFDRDLIAMTFAAELGLTFDAVPLGLELEVVHLPEQGAELGLTFDPDLRGVEFDA